jgi:ribosomal protein S18 acetylase RimI-like enzyme
MTECIFHTICVESGSRGKGIGAAVLNEPAEENPKMYLYVNDKNDAAIRFYEKNGFRKKNHGKMKYKGNELGEYLMERK